MIKKILIIPHTWVIYGNYLSTIRKAFIAFIWLIIHNQMPAQVLNTWETIEITLEASNTYKNPYTDIEIWVELQGPGFTNKVYGFWDGEKKFKVRLMATNPGEWTWSSFSNPYDQGLSGQTGKFSAKAPTSEEILKNPNLRGIIQTNQNAPHGFIYADGTPFFMLADTWWAASTWRYPYKGGVLIPEAYIPEEKNWSFEGGIHWMKKHGYNSIALISCFPNWKVDEYGPVVEDDENVTIRNAASWGKAPLGEKVKDMHDEKGQMPFMFPGKCIGKVNICADFDRINPLYWQSLDKKMDYLWHQGFVPYMETIRRDQLPVWIKYYDFNNSFARFLNYLKARYGTYNFIFSLIHYDGVQRGVSIENLREAFVFYHKKYGGMPFGQPVTAMLQESTLKNLGNIDTEPYLTCHSGGNTNREHGILAEIRAMYDAKPAAPVFNNEPYYPMLMTDYARRASSVKVESNSELDNYFGRSHMYSNFFSGSLGGYIFGTGAFGGDSYEEPPYIKEPVRWPKIWDALKIDAWLQGAWYREFVRSLGIDYQSMIPSHENLSEPRNETKALFDWAYMLRSKDNKLILLYFERNAKRQKIYNLIPNLKYAGFWYNPRNGEWIPFIDCLRADDKGQITMPPFPGNHQYASDDWAAKLVGQ